MLTPNQLFGLLNRPEMPCVDFKGGEYDLSSPRGDKGKGYLDLIKDILCMSNTPRQEGAFIFTGIVNRSGSQNRAVGIRKNIDDNDIQNLLRDWLYPIPPVHYYQLRYKQKEIGVFEIPPDQLRGPYYVRADLNGAYKRILVNEGKFLSQDQIYFRRGTTNDWARESDKAYIMDWFQSYIDERWQDWGEFKGCCDYFDERRHFVLITSALSYMEQSALESLSHIGWSAVIDFDSESENTGLLKAIQSQTFARNVIRAVKGEYRSFNSWHNTYWFFANGLKGRQQTLIRSNDWKVWRSSYGREIDLQFDHIAQTLLPNPVTFVILWNDDSQLRHLQTTIESTTGFDYAKYVVVSDTVSRIKIRIEEDFDASYFDIPLHQLTSGLAVEFPSRSLEGISYTMPGMFGSPVSAERLPSILSQLELVHLGLGMPSAAEESSEDPEADFLRGGVITWDELNLQRDAERDITRVVSRRVREDLSRRDAQRIEVQHIPGAGGTTVAKRVVWDLHRENPSVVVHSRDTKGVVDSIEYIALETRSSVLALVDSALHSEKDIEDILGLLQSRNIPCVLLSVSRRHQLSRQSKRSFPLKGQLTNSELPRFFDKFVHAVPYKRAKLQALRQPDSRDIHTAFHFGLTAYEQDYRGITSYVAHRVNGLTDIQSKIVAFLCIAYKYGQKGIPGQAFQYLLELPRQDVSLPEAFSERPSVLDLLLLERREWRPIHQLVADETLRQLLTDENADRRRWRQQLSSWATRFVDFCREGYLVQSNTVLDLLRRVFIERDDSDETVQRGDDIGPVNARGRRFAKLIDDIPSREGQLRVLQHLCDAFPTEPHYWAHLGRFQAAQMKNFQAAQESADLSISLAEDDPLLWHMKGMSFRYHMSETIASRGKIDEVVGLAKKASECFEESRKLNPENDRGYISEIQLLVSMLNYVVRVSEGSLFNYVSRIDASPYVRDAIDRAESLLAIVRSNREGIGSSKYERDCRAGISKLYGEYEEALQIWENMLSRQNVHHPPIRRQIVYALLARDNSWQEMRQKSRDRCTRLLQSNLDEQPNNDRDLRLWLQSVRYSTQRPTIEYVIERITYWKSNTGSLDATYYLYVLYSLLALEGFTIERKFAENNMEECKQMSQYRRNRSKSKEWLGKKEGIGKLVHQSTLGDWNRDNGFWSSDKALQLQRVEGVITRVVGPQAGNIEIAGLPAFFVPGKSFSSDSVNRRVDFFLGFSYSGMRAWRVEFS